MATSTHTVKTGQQAQGMSITKVASSTDWKLTLTDSAGDVATFQGSGDALRQFAREIDQAVSGK